MTKTMIKSVTLAALLLAGNPNTVDSMETSPHGVIGSNAITLCTEPPIQKIHLCLVKEVGTGQFKYRQIALIDEGDTLNYPNFLLDSKAGLKEAACSYLADKFNLKFNEEDIHRFGHFEYFTEANQKNIHKFMIVFLDTSVKNANLNFQEFANPIFNPKNHSHSITKPVRNPIRLATLNEIISSGLSGEMVSDYNKSKFNKILDSYGEKKTGYLTITPFIFEKYAQKRVSKEIKPDCIIF